MTSDHQKAYAKWMLLISRSFHAKIEYKTLETPSFGKTGIKWRKAVFRLLQTLREKRKTKKGD